MEKRETRRINPIAQITLTAVLVLVLFELLIIFGAMQLEARTVAKIAPWAYEPFLKLVGEHPESTPRWAVVEETDESAAADSPVAGVAGLQPMAIPVLTETNAPAETNAPPDTDTGNETPSVPEAEPTAAPDKKPSQKPDEAVPVG